MKFLIIKKINWIGLIPVGFAESRRDGGPQEVVLEALGRKRGAELGCVVRKLISCRVLDRASRRNVDLTVKRTPEIARNVQWVVVFGSRSRRLSGLKADVLLSPHENTVPGDGTYGCSAHFAEATAYGYLPAIFVVGWNKRLLTTEFLSALTIAASFSCFRSNSN